MALMSLCTAAVVPLPVKITASSSAAFVALRNISRASCRKSVVCRDVTDVVVCVFP